MTTSIGESPASRMLRWIGPRLTIRARDISAWILAIGIATTVLPANESLGGQALFFSAHQTTPFTLMAVWLVAVASLWVALAVFIAIVHRGTTPGAFDALVSSATFACAYILLVGALPAGAWWMIAAPVALIYALLTRRWRTGVSALVIMTAVAMFPLVVSQQTSGNPLESRKVGEATGGSRPDVLLIVVDEVQYPLVFDSAGQVRDEFPNLRSFQRQATTYTHAYSTANGTQTSIPAILNGVGVVPADKDGWTEMTTSPGLMSWLTPWYDTTVLSEIFTDMCHTTNCTSGDSDAAAWPSRIGLLAADAATLAGKHLPDIIADRLPTTDGRWRDYWGLEEEAPAVHDSPAVVEELMTTSHSRPQFALWHYLDTHAPFGRDFDGLKMFRWNPGIGGGLGTLGANRNGSFPNEKARLVSRQMYAAEAQHFDRLFGDLLTTLQASDNWERTMVIVTSDHGRSFPDTQHSRVGDDTVMRWSEVAHVPLLVKEPGQSAGTLVGGNRSTAQIASTVLEAAGLRLEDEEPPVFPGLGQDPEGPFFWSDLGEGRSILEEVPADLAPSSPWTTEALNPASDEAQFATIDDDLTPGQELTGGWSPFQMSSVSAHADESPYQLLVVTTESTACRSRNSRVAVLLENSLVGQVMWDESDEAPDSGRRGWAIVPRPNSASADYEFRCDDNRTGGTDD